MSKTKGKKLKRWQKGQSCTSNPEYKRFREAAANKGFKRSVLPSALTVTALQQHDGESGMDVDSDHFDAKTFHTWATNFTDCTNITFSRVHKLWNSNNALHKEILALLASLTEVIKENGGTGTETEYFAALLTYMDTVESQESAAAGAVLLNMAVRKIPCTTLQARFSDISKRVLEAIAKYADSDDTSLLKSLLMSLAFVLKAQKVTAWNVSSTTNAFRILLHFTLHKKPRVRKAGQEAVQMILKRSVFLTLPDSPAHHPAAVHAADFCISTIKQSGKLGTTEKDALHVLNFLEGVIATFPQKQIKTSCETLLQLMFINKPEVKVNGMAALYRLFEKHPPAASLPDDLNAQIINALYDHQPTENDNGTMPGWLAVMEQAHVNLSRLNATLCVDHLPRLFSVAMKCLLSHHKDVRTSAVKLTNLLLKECIGSHTDKLAQKMQNAQAVGPETSLHKVVRALEAGLSFQYNASWDMVMQILATMMEALGKICPDLLKKCLESVAMLRDTATFSYKTDVDVVVGKAVRFMGPRQVLNAIPLKITGIEDIPDLSRSWLLPVIRDNLCETELSFFTTYFFDLAQKFRNKAKALAAQDQQAACKTYEMLEMQLWSMLKGFCTHPTDLAQSFKGLAKKLGMCLNERSDLQMDILAALRSLINFSKENAADKAAMSQYAQNFIPILFNLFTSNPDNPRDGHRLAVLETIKVYFSITDSECIYKFLDMGFTKITAENITPFKKIALVDLFIAMLKYADQPRLAKLYSLVRENIQASDKTLQKKAYRVLEEICMCETQTCQQFLSHNLTEIQQLLLDSLSSSAPSTRNPRLRCLTCICQQLAEANRTFIQAVVPEAIMCTRGVGERARAAAYHLIVEVSRALMRWNPEAEEQEILSQYVNMLLAGLSGSPEMICGTLLALTRIMYHYKEKLSGSTLSSMMAVICLLMSSERREVARAAVDFVKIFIGAYRNDVLCAHLSEMVNGISSMKTQTRQSCHTKTKQIFKKLIKKFGYEAVLKLTPQKILVVVQKANSEVKQDKKKKEQRGQAANDEDSDEELVKQKPETLEEILQFSEEEDEEEGGKKGIEKSSHRKAFIREEDGDVLDILDKSAARKVMASKPKSSAEGSAVKEKEEHNEGFKLAPDGRLIITDTEEKDHGGRQDSGEEEDMDDLLAAIEGGSDKKRRKRLRDAAKHADEDDEPTKKYKPGGTGIHRPLKKQEFGAEYRSKKGAGDIKKAGKHDPYTYVQLDFSSLNKRKQAKLKGQFSGLVKGAKKGAAKGRKGMLRTRNARKAAQKHAASK